MSRYWDGAAWTEQLAPLNTAAPGQIGTHYSVDAMGQPVSPSSRLAATLLCFFLGVLGGLGIWTLIDLVMIIVGAFRDKQDRLLLNW